MAESDKTQNPGKESLAQEERVAGPAPSAEDSSLVSSVTWPVQRAVWAIERHAIWPAADALRHLVDVATWPFERVIWAFRSRVAWPTQDRIAASGRPVRTVIAVGAAGAAVAAVSAGALVGAPGKSSGQTDAAPAPVGASAAPIVVPGGSRIPLDLAELGQTDAPVLHGIAPDFKAADPKAAGNDLATTDAAPSSDPVDTPPAAPGTGAPGTTDAAGADARAKVPAPATIKPALAVSRQFADAFVLYEVGKNTPVVTKAFTKTAAKPLIRALNKRPPRLPQGVKVPKAKVLNVVPGPRDGKALSVSVALLRLGASSELRLELRHDQRAGWLVSDVRG